MPRTALHPYPSSGTLCSKHLVSLARIVAMPLSFCSCITPRRKHHGIKERLKLKKNNWALFLPEISQSRHTQYCQSWWHPCAGWRFLYGTRCSTGSSWHTCHWCWTLAGLSCSNNNRPCPNNTHGPAPSGAGSRDSPWFHCLLTASR